MSFWCESQVVYADHPSGDLLGTKMPVSMRFIRLSKMRVKKMYVFLLGDTCSKLSIKGNFVVFIARRLCASNV